VASVGVGAWRWNSGGRHHIGGVVWRALAGSALSRVTVVHCYWDLDRNIRRHLLRSEIGESFPGGSEWMNEFHLRAKRVLLEILLLDIVLGLLWLIWNSGRYVVSGMLLGGIVSLYQVFSIAVQTEKVGAFATGQMRRKPVFGMVSRWAAVLLAGAIVANVPQISILGTVAGLCIGWLLLLIDVIAFSKANSK
jgi:hypothetical protein